LTSAGTVSGRVTDESDQPIGEIDVGACEYIESDNTLCSGARTDENGYYSILLPAGIYRVFVQGQPGWANEFFFDTPVWGDAVPVTAIVGADVPGIDFSLALGGNISGFVYGENNTPLGGIAVDTEFGGYGTCTDENGFYTLSGLPFGTYNVVAGRLFCSEHAYGEQITNNITTDPGSPDVRDIDFSLQLLP
jgi:hypothetical protein